jgi:hypothetical protein
MSQGVVGNPPSDLYVTLYDDTGTELDGDLQNGRVQTAAGTDWDVTNTSFENASEINFGDALADITVQEVAIFDAATGGNEIARYAIDSAPDSRNSGTRIFFPAGDLSFDVVDRTE